MELGLGLGICRGGRVAWTPASLTGLAATVLPALSRSQGKLWQDTAKTIAATADGDPVRVAVCPFTAVEFTAASDATRPLLYDEGGGLWSLFGDGVDDCLRATFSTGAVMDVYTVALASNHTGNNTYFDAANGTINTMRMFKNFPYAPWAYTQGGSILGDAISLGSYYLIQASYNGASSLVRVNGGTPVTGTMGSVAAAAGATIMANANVPPLEQFDGRMGDWLIYTGALSAADRQQLETYLMDKWGLP